MTGVLCFWCNGHYDPGVTRTLSRMVNRLDRGRAPRLLALLALAALLAPSVSRYAGAEAPGWFPEHGHVYLDPAAAAHQHSHPWDHPGPEPKPSEATGVVFTLGDLQSASVAVLALPAFALLLAIAWRTFVTEAPRVMVRSRFLLPLDCPP